LESTSYIVPRTDDPLLFPPYSYKRFALVIKTIGLPYLEEFNGWAFRKHPMQYNDDLVVLWREFHKPTIESHDPDIILDEIMRLWKCKQDDEWLGVLDDPAA
jgi:hypothetical protein